MPNPNVINAHQTQNAFKNALKQPGLVFFAFFLGLLNLSNSYATDEQPSHQTHESLYKLVQNYLKQKTDQHLYNATFDIQPLSRHIQFDTCKTEPELTDKNPTDFTGRNTFNIACPNPEWSIYMTATIQGDLPVIMSTQGILKQAVIKQDDVKKILIPYQKVKKGSLIHLENVIGNRAKRAIAPNSIITIRDVQPPYWVFKDKPVNLITQIGNIKIETKGIALNNAVEQGQVNVKNLSSQKTVKGIVIAPNTVWIP